MGNSRKRSKNRIHAVDLTRGLSVILMIMIHTVLIYGSDMPYDTDTKRVVNNQKESETIRNNCYSITWNEKHGKTH